MSPVGPGQDSARVIKDRRLSGSGVPLMCDTLTETVSDGTGFHLLVSVGCPEGLYGVGVDLHSQRDGPGRHE